MEFGVEERERLLANVVDYGLDEANIEETDISDEAADYDQNDFYEINDLENQEESKMDIDKPFEDVSEFEQKQRQIFIELFKSGKYLNASSIYQSRKLKWSRSKIFNVFEYYKLYNSFKNDKRLSSPLRIEKMSDKAKEKCIELIENDSNMSSRKISVILRDKNLANVSKTTIVNALNKLGYTYKTPKLKIKNLQLQKDARYNWCLRHINTTFFYGVFFSDECTFYLNNPCGSKWVKSNQDNIIFSKNKGRKIGAWGAISSYGKTSLYLYEENFNADTYINILQEAINEMRDFTTEEKITMQMDNARYHWTNEVLQFLRRKLHQGYWLATIFPRP